MFDDVGGPRHSRVDTDEPVLRESGEHFTDAIASLAQGELTFPAPFDLVTSWALARNDDDGAAALESFARMASGSGRRFLIRIHALPSDDEPGDKREIIDTIVTGMRLAAETLSSLAVDMVNGAGNSFQIRIHELPPTDQPGVGEREIVDTIANGSRIAAQILVSLATEMVDSPDR